MEQNSIGTDASTATHINNICERRYVDVVGKARRLVPTDLGNALIHSYAEIDPELVAPELRSSIEKSVELIARGEVKYEKVLNDVIDLFKQKFAYFVSNIEKADAFFSNKFASIEQAVERAPLFSKCGRCNSNMKIIDNIYKLYCEKCKYMYGLPRNSTYELAQDCFCPLDGFQLLICNQVVRGNTKRHSICPACFQKAPDVEDLDVLADKFARLSCSLCTNALCQFSMMNNSIGRCTNCDKGGKLIIDWPTG